MNVQPRAGEGPHRAPLLVLITLTLGAVGLKPPVAHAQVPMEWSQHLSPDYPASLNWGRGLCRTDANSDGFDDLFVLETGATVAGKTQAGRVWLMYGPTFTSWQSFASSDPAHGEKMGETYAFSFNLEGCSVGDVDGDGSVDILVGAPNYFQTSPLVPGAGRAHLFFGPDYATEVILTDPTQAPESHFGAAVLLADITRDGRADVIVGVPGATYWAPHTQPIDEAGEVWYWDALELETPHRITNPVPMPLARFGSSLDAADLDGDAVPELLAGARGHHVSLPASWGAIHVFDGVSGAYSHAILVPGMPGLVPVAFGDVIHHGDVTGDDISDLVVAAPFSWFECQDAGALFVLEGPGFDTASHVLSSPNKCKPSTGVFGGIAVVCDVDRDGAPDIVAGDSGQPWGKERTWVFYGPDFETVSELGDDLPFITVAFGIGVEALDVDGDGWQELAIHATEGSAVGSLYVYDVRTLQADVSALSVSMGGTVTFSLDGTAGRAGGLYLAAVGSSGSSPGLVPAPGVYLPLTVDPITIVGLSLVNGPLMPGFAGVLDAAGSATFQLVWPPGSAGGLVGQTLTIAAVTATAQGQLLSGSSRVEIDIVQ